MATIITDNPAIETCLVNLLSRLEACGARFAENMLIRSFDGDLSIEARSKARGKWLIYLPETVLIPVDKFDLTLRGGELHLQGHSPDVASETIDAMQMMLELYKLTHKIDTYRKTAPLLFLSHYPDLLNAVLQLRNSPAIIETAEGFTGGADDKCIINSFLKTRTVGYNFGSEESECMMPVIDFLNHHLQGAPIHKVDSKTKRGLSILPSKPIQGSYECYATYGLYDHFDTWLLYQFFENPAPFTRSVVMEIDLGEIGKIKVNAHSVEVGMDGLSPQLADIAWAIPGIMAEMPGFLKISHLYIPTADAPRALRRVLDFLLAFMGVAPTQRQELILHAETQVVEKNIERYQMLKTMAETTQLTDQNHEPIRNDLMRLCDVQIERIEQYKQYAM